MDLLELPSMGSLPACGLCSPTVWDKVMAEAVFCSSAADEPTTMASSGSPTGMPYYGSGAAYLSGATCVMQALKSAECSSDTSAVLVETTWAPSNHSGSCAQSSDSATSDGGAAPGELTADTRAPGGAVAERVVRRSRARRNQHTDAASAHAIEQEHQTHAAQQAQCHSHVQTLEPTPAQLRPDWAFNKGPSLSGVVRPFESVKGYGGVSLQDINAALKSFQRPQ